MEIIEEVYTILENRKQNALKKITDLEYQLSSNEEYSTLLRQKAKINRLLGNASFENNQVEIDRLEIELNNIEKNISNYLKENNIIIPKKPNYYCPICSDTGFTNNNTCKCFRDLYSSILFDRLGIKKQELHTFTQDTISNNSEIKEYYDLLKDYSTSPQKDNYVFYGKCGTGKTFLAQCVASSFDSDKQVIYLSSMELNNIFVKYHTSPIDEKYFYFSTIADCELLVIDDFGTEPIFNKVTLETFYSLFDYRVSKNYPMIITTNLSPKEILSKYGERIFSRLLQNKKTHILEFPDVNLRK